MFEYKVILVDPTWSAKEGLTNIEQQLNELGQQGWKLVPVTLGGYLFLERYIRDAED